MSSLQRFLSRIVWTLFLLPLCWAQARPSGTAPTDYIGRAQSLIHILYPQLDPRLRIVVEDSRKWGDAAPANMFSIDLCDPDSRGTGQCICPHRVLSTNIVFDALNEDHQLIEFAADGLPVTGERNKLLDLMAEHPDWSDSDLAQRLRSAGAKFGPEDRNDFLRHLPVQELRPFIGQLEVLSVEFEFRDKESPKNGLTWVVEAKALQPGNKERKYVLLFEPFEGKVVLISGSIVPVIRK